MQDVNDEIVDVRASLMMGLAIEVTKQTMDKSIGKQHPILD